MPADEPKYRTVGDPSAPPPDLPLLGARAEKAAVIRSATKALIDMIKDLGLSRHTDAAIMHVEDAESRVRRHLQNEPGS